MNLPDLHRHLDGSMRRSTLLELARSAAVTVASDLRFHAGMGLQAALACFEATLSTLQHPPAVERVASEICDDARTENVTTLEIRFAPQLHRGADLGSIIDAAVSGAAGRAGIILCALYDDPPELVENLVTLGKARKGVVALDLAGGPAPSHRYGMREYARAFTMARDAGMGRTVHAGEGRPPDEIRVAIEHLHAQRIGHGTTLLQDERVVDLVRERNVTIEACPTSNVHTGVIQNVSEHPIAQWLQLGIRACINTDNTLLSDVTAPQEHERTLRADGMDQELLERCVAHGHAAAFRR